MYEAFTILISILSMAAIFTLLIDFFWYLDEKHGNHSASLILKFENLIKRK